MTVLVGCRAVTVMSVLTVSRFVLNSPPGGGLYLGMYAANLAVLLVLIVRSVQIRRPLGPRWVIFEVAFDVMLLLWSAIDMPPEFRIGSWIGFAPGTALCAAVAAGITLDWRRHLGAVVLISSAYLILVGPLMSTNRLVVLNNVLTYSLWSVMGRVSAGFLRGMANSADVAKAEAARLARTEAEYRARISMHDGVGLMAQLSSDGVSRDQRERLTEQLEGELRRMQAYLRDGSHEPSESAAQRDSGEALLLTESLKRGMSGFEDLGLEVSIDLLDGVEVMRDLGVAVEQAIRTALLNVRWHAKARMVIVHGDSEIDDEDRVHWTVVVRDDGRGFDPATTQLGIGLSLQVLTALERADASARIQSQPGFGTTVTLSGGCA